ncbi:MAG: 16S rRNA (uracil(1498)-N(3))-methyltransferase [Alphaproteobacteria bacterium]|nr:16S rRNA (uracil(1498)-N(3))-methyltransferase [Alphaproteobacteria bacterium]
MIRLYVERPFLENQEISLSENQSHYVQKVMRLKQNDELLVFNGTEGEWKAIIRTHLKKTTELTLLYQNRPQESPNNLWLLFSPLKPKRQEFLEEKATELGVSCLMPIQFEHTTCKVNGEKMRAHVIEAAEQCKRLTIPEIKPLLPFSDLLRSWPEDRSLLFGDETLTSLPVKNVEIDSRKFYGFLVGPEGGFTSQELTLLKSHPKAQGVVLNHNILRSETAALAGISYLQIAVQKET